ncbi:MAG: ArnT family glycosyltransferase [Gemmatimonadota bacterium]
MRSNRRAAVVVFTLGLVVGLAFQGSRGLYETTEGRYAEAGREMLETGDWVVPRLDYLPHWTKPPATYWTIAAGIAALGPNAWGVRLVNGLMLPLGGLLVLLLGSTMLGPRVGALAGIIYVTSLFPATASATVSTDMLLALAEALTALCYWAAIRAPDTQRERKWVAGMWTASGLAFLIKGPPGLLTLLVILVHRGVAWRRGWKTVRLTSAAGFVGFALVGLGWYAYVVATTPGLLRYFLADEVVARVATDRFRRNPQWYKPPLIYGPPLLLGLGIWMVPVLGSWRKRSRRTEGPRRREVWRRWLATSEGWFLAAWLLIPLVILTLSRSRLPLYVLPFFPALVLAAAGILASRGNRPESAQASPLRRAAPWALAGAVLLVGLKAAAAHVASPKDMRRLYETVAPLLAPEDRIVAVDEPRLYGLQFYLGGRMERARLELGRTRQDSEPPRFTTEGGAAPELEAWLRGAWKEVGGSRPGSAQGSPRGNLLLLTRAPDKVMPVACPPPRRCSTHVLAGGFSLIRLRREPAPEG